ncbi:MAG: glycogen debranching protein [Firmicutes bacterium]|nr:glycogen debranching protein [Bacillota bacterium]
MLGVIGAARSGESRTIPALLTGSLEMDSTREWLASNGLGGWASSTVAGVNTRRYHGLLVAATRPPAGRVLLLSKVEDRAILGGVDYHLSSNFYPGVVHPDGYSRLTAFEMAPFPIYTYEFGGAVLTKEIVPLHGRNAMLVLYTVLESRSPVTLHLEPLVNNRDYHGITSRPGWDFAKEALPAPADVRRGALGSAGVLVSPPWGGVSLSLWLISGGRDEPPARTPEYSARGVWYRDMEYPAERARGLEFREDHYSPGVFSVALEQGELAGLYAAAIMPGEAWAGAGRCAGEALPGGFVPPIGLRETRVEEAAALRRRTSLDKAVFDVVAEPSRDPEFETALAGAADSFIVTAPDPRGAALGSTRRLATTPPQNPARRSAKTPSPSSIIAGYHWFEEWGRDAFVSLPGLCLVTGRYSEARSVIAHFAGYVRDGLVPNRIPAPGREAEYGSVDASLWMVYALWKYLQYTSDMEFAAEMLGVVTGIVDAYLEGTRFGIRATPNGMLWQGEPGMQITWMDAKAGDRVVTPRTGWAVEVNGLWYNALQVASALCRAFPESPANVARAERYASTARLMKKSFDYLMLDRRLGYAVDVRDGHGPDRSLRPNQLICMFLPFPVIDAEAAQPALRVIMDRLLIPTGVRTLDPGDPRYRGRYCGGVTERDEAYHQGTAWAWLMGPLITALRRADGYSERSRALAGRLLHPFKAHLYEAGLGTVSEVFDGDPPHAPGGCISQAWSVAEIYRAYVEEYLEAGPPHGSIAHADRG